jgi:hypothetical protein
MRCAFKLEIVRLLPRMRPRMPYRSTQRLLRVVANKMIARRWQITNRKADLLCLSCV